MNHIHAVAIFMLAGCAKPSVDPQQIAPDVSSAASSGTGGAGVGGHGASSAAGSAGSGDMGDDSGPSSESGSRLKIASYVSDDGFSLVRQEAFDSELGFYCRFLPAPDGSIRCFPTTWAASVYYTDPECTHAVATIPMCDIDGLGHAAGREHISISGCSIYVYRALMILSGVRTVTDIYQKTSIGCEITHGSRVDVFDVAIIPTESLARATSEVDGT